MKSLLLLTVDSLRADALGCLGAPGNPTPEMDRLARAGVLFTQAVSAGPRTPSAFPAILASLPPLAAGEERLPAGVPTLAEVLGAAGRRTAGFNLDNPYLTSRQGYARGFDRFDDFWSRGTGDGRRSLTGRLKKGVQDAIGRRSLPALLFLQAALRHDGGPFQRGGEMVGRALEWVDAEPGRPFFLWIHLMDVHFPYLPRRGEYAAADTLRFTGALAGLAARRRGYPLRLLRRLYGRKVAEADRLIGRLVGGLEERGLWEKTVWALTADHGELLGEHGGFTHGPEPWEELLRVPLIVGGGGLEGGTVVDGPRGLVDLAPTLLDLLGLPSPPAFEGEDALARRSVDGAAPVFSAATHDGRERRGRRRSGERVRGRYELVVCRAGGWKYVFDEEEGREELFHLDDDPGEERNLAAAHPEKTAELAAAVADYRRRAKESREGFPDVSRDERDEAQLRRRLADLGYL